MTFIVIKFQPKLESQHFDYLNAKIVTVKY